jgi:probable sporulation protein (polysaccharide deacetylase family)
LDIYVVTFAQIRRLIIIGITIMVALISLPQIPAMVRHINGVAEGVELEGQLISGYLPHEVKSMVRSMAKHIFRSPINAGYFQETGELIPEVDGVAVDVEGTVRKVLEAKPGEKVSLVKYRVTASRDRSYYIPVYEARTKRPQVSLTFNVAWGEEEILHILDTLRQTQTHATFYFVGSWVKKFPELVREVAKDGHEIANHGLYHGHPAQMSRDELVRLIQTNHDLLKNTIDKEPVRLFAPPYGEFDQDVLSVAGDLGFRTILWSVDTVDWKRPAPEVIRERVKSKIRPGGIILMHPTAPTRAVLRQLILDLKEKGLHPVAVSQLLRDNGETVTETDDMD